tara:strand:+ start:1526 stop:1906 length:381 start_codon:yes stop_codon:yes gene_type:complete
MKKITIKFKYGEYFGGENIIFTLPDGRKCDATEIGYENVSVGDYADINQYRYRTKYYDEYGFDLGEFDNKDLVEYTMSGFVECDGDVVKFVKILCREWCKVVGLFDDEGSFEINEKYLELVNKGNK